MAAWEDFARISPAIQKWYASISARRGMSQDVVDFMKKDTSYDYKAAIEGGAIPVMTEHGEMHWPDVVKGKKLKSLLHPTREMSDERTPTHPRNWDEYLFGGPR